MEITLNTNDCTAIAAMAKHVAPAKEQRYYLTGVCIECTSAGWLAIATNGHMLTIGLLENALIDAAPIGTQIIVPRDAALALAKCKGFAVLSFDTQGGPRTLRHGDVTMTLDAALTEARFPDWRMVVPKTISGETAQFNPDYLTAIQSVADAMANSRKGSHTSWRLCHNGDGCSQVTFDSVELLGLVMPVREGKCAPAVRPYWVLNDASTAARELVEAIAA